MRILTALISYNRPELLKRTVESYQATVAGPHRLLIIDNGSDIKTRRWLHHTGLDCLFLGENRYPGPATNLGWTRLLADRRLGPNLLLHRSDNDVEYLPGWCDEVRRRFTLEPDLGQLGLRTVEEEGACPNVGGNNVIRRRVFEQGFRYPELPWTACPFEDGSISPALGAGGWRWDRAEQPCIIHTGIASSGDPYYQQTFRTRGITFLEWGVA